jgi:4a-hydroxytetrahydrobiopterin dehydratase
MAELKRQICEACSPNSEHITQAEIEALKPEIPGWMIVNYAGELRLEKVYKFPDFKAAIAFTNLVGEVAEAAGHHPALLTEWGKVTVTWWTHAIYGLHKNDFIMAAKTDAIAESAF